MGSPGWTMPAQWQPIADWCKAPPPTFLGDAHALHFWLQHPTGITYQGFLYYHEGTPPISRYHGHPYLLGTGMVIANPPYVFRYQRTSGLDTPAEWVRIVMNLGGTADLSFFEGEVPRTQTGWEEQDVTSFTSYAPYNLTRWWMQLGEWGLTIDTTTLLL